MAIPWSQVEQSDSYKNLDDSSKQSAKQQYFSDVVMPHLQPSDVDAAKSQFFGDATQARVAPTQQPVTQVQPNRAMEDVKALGSGLLSGVIGPGQMLASGLRNMQPAQMLANPIIGAGSLAVRLLDTIKSRSQTLRDVATSVKDFSNRATTTPEGAYIKKVGEFAPMMIGGPESLAIKALRTAGSGVGAQAGGQYLGAPGEFVGGLVGGGFIPNPLKVVNTLKDIAKSGVKKEITPLEKAASDSIKAGYRVPPSEIRPTVVQKSVEGFSGKLATQQKLSRINQENTNRLAKQSIGLPLDKDITLDAIKSVRQKAGQSYSDVSNVKAPIKADREFFKSVSGLRGDLNAASKEFPDLLKNKEVDNLVDALRKSSFSAKAGLQLVRKLRESATTNIKFGDVEKAELGYAQRKAADSIDALMERNISKTNPDIINKYREARKTLAKTYDVEAAMNESTGNISASHFSKLRDKGRPLSGELKQISDFHGAFPKAAQSVEKMGSTPGVSPLDYLAATGAGLATHNPLAIAAVGARPAVRALITSRAYQKQLMKEPGKISLKDIGNMGRGSVVSASNTGERN